MLAGDPIDQRHVDLSHEPLDGWPRYAADKHQPLDNVSVDVCNEPKPGANCPRRRRQGENIWNVGGYAGNANDGEEQHHHPIKDGELLQVSMGDTSPPPKE